MPIHSDKNLYPGINPHLNSLLQNEPGAWESFHADHVTDLARGIDRVLPPGYFARAEKSLQVSESVAATLRIGDIKPDVTVYRAARPKSASPAAVPAATPPTATLPIPETLTEEEQLSSVVIYQAGEGSVLGRPIARVELLSPANNPSGSYYSRYMEKRLQTLQSGLRIVEIDYLHEIRLILGVLASYADSKTGAFPYSVLVTDPRPTMDKGYTHFYGFGVLDSLPVVTIPLAGADEVIIDLGPIYNTTFDGLQYYRLIVDYAQEPVNFEAYTEPDRERIRRRMAEIAASQPSGT